MNKPASLGIIIGNRDFFPDQLVEKARLEILEVFAKLNLRPILLGPQDTKLGGVETFQESRRLRNTGKIFWGFWFCCPTLAMKRALLMH